MNAQTKALKKLFMVQFDIARQEGMLKSKDGKHSRFSEGDAESCLQACKDAGLIFIPSYFLTSEYNPLLWKQIKEQLIPIDLEEEKHD